MTEALPPNSFLGTKFVVILPKRELKGQVLNLEEH